MSLAHGQGQEDQSVVLRYIERASAASAPENSRQSAVFAKNILYSFLEAMNIAACAGIRVHENVRTSRDLYLRVKCQNKIDVRDNQHRLYVCS